MGWRALERAGEDPDVTYAEANPILARLRELLVWDELLMDEWLVWGLCDVRGIGFHLRNDCKRAALMRGSRVPQRLGDVWGGSCCPDCGGDLIFALEDLEREVVIALDRVLSGRINDVKFGGRSVWWSLMTNASIWTRAGRSTLERVRDSLEESLPAASVSADVVVVDSASQGRVARSVLAFCAEETGLWAARGGLVACGMTKRRWDNWTWHHADEVLVTGYSFVELDEKDAVSRESLAWVLELCQGDESRLAGAMEVWRGMTRAGEVI